MKLHLHKNSKIKSIKLKKGTLLSEGLQELNKDYTLPCKGRGKCEKCKVYLIEGSLKGGEVKKGVYLACQSKLKDEDVRVSLKKPTKEVKK